MNLHEYQSKKIFAEYGIPVPQGAVASTPRKRRSPLPENSAARSGW